MMRFTNIPVVLGIAAVMLFHAASARNTFAQESAVRPLNLTWIGQGNDDLTGYRNLPMPNGVNDFVVEVNGASLLSASPVQWTIHADSPLGAHLDWAWPQTAQQLSGIAVVPSGGSYRLHFDPYLSVAGDVIRVTVAFADGSIQSGQVVSEGVRWGAVAEWAGQTHEDHVGRTDRPNGTRDWMIEVSDPDFRPGNVREWTIWQNYPLSDPNFNEYWSWKGPAPPEHPTERPIRVSNSGTKARLYFDPALAREGDQFVVQAVMEDGMTMAWILAGGGSEWGESAVYHGRVETDLVGETEAVPNGVNDLMMDLLDPSLGGGIRRIKVTSNGLKWEWPLGPGTEADADSRYAKVEVKSGVLRVWLDNADETAGQFYFASVVLNDGRLLGWAVMTSRTNNTTDIAWLGQTEDVLSPYAWEAGRLNALEFPPDGDLDLAVRVSHPLLGISPVKEWRVEGAGLAWGNPAGAVVALHPATGRPVVTSGFATGATPYSPVAIKDAGAGLSVPAVGSSERIIYFAEPRQAVPRGSRFVVTAILADGNVIVWRLASPGSPVLTGMKWKGMDRGKYVIAFDAPPGVLNVARARSETHTWSTHGTAAQVDAVLAGSGKTATLRLDSKDSGLQPGSKLEVELTDGAGIRHYGAVFSSED